MKLEKSNLKNAVLDVWYADKYIEEAFKVTRFVLKIPDFNAIIVYGDKIDDKTCQILYNKVSKSDEILIFDIQVKVINSKINPMCIRPIPMILQIL